MPLLILMAGTTGSGKTTVAKMLARSLRRTQHLESDLIRKRLAGVPSSAHVATRNLLGGIYSKEMTTATYEEMNRQAARLVTNGFSVILDGSFRQRRRRAAVREMFRLPGVGIVTIECHVEQSEQLIRLETRYRAEVTASDGRPELLAFHERDWESVEPDEGDLVFRVNTLVPPAAIEDLFACHAPMAELIATCPTVR